MIEILFRGKRRDSDEWVEGDFCRPSNIVFEKLEFDEVLKRKETVWEDCLVIPESVGLFSGRKDMNGNKIFAGHLVKSKYAPEELFEIKYGVYWAFCPEDERICETVGFYVTAKERDDMPLGNTEDWAEIVGNVFEEEAMT